MGYSLGDTLIGMVLLILIVIPRQLLPLAQQTGHTHGPWDSAGQGLLLVPQGSPSVTFSSQIPDHSPSCHTHHSTPHPQLSTFTSVCVPLPQLLRPHRDQGDRVRRTVGKHGSRAGRKIERQERDSELERHNIPSRGKVT